MEKVAKNGQPYFFAVFFPFMKNGRKVKAIALLFCCFLPTYEKWKKTIKMDEKLGYSLIFLLFFAHL
jgi:hypothetical protein